MNNAGRTYACPLAILRNRTSKRQRNETPAFPIDAGEETSVTWRREQGERVTSTLGARPQGRERAPIAPARPPCCPALFRQEADDGTEARGRGIGYRDRGREETDDGVVESNGSVGKCSRRRWRCRWGQEGGAGTTCFYPSSPSAPLAPPIVLLVRGEGGCTRNGARHNATTEITTTWGPGAPKFPTAGARALPNACALSRFSRVPTSKWRRRRRTRCPAGASILRVAGTSKTGASRP